MNASRLCLWGLISAVLLVTGWEPVLGQNRMTPELLWKLGRVSGGVLSSNGENLAYAVRRYDLPQNQGRSELRWVNLATGSDQVVLSDLASLADLQWVTTGGEERLFFTASFPDEARKTPQAWSLAVGESQPKQVTSFETGVANLKVSPTGLHLAYTADIKLDKTVNELYADLPHADARIIDSLMYRHWNAWHDYAYTHLHVAPLQDDGTAGVPRDLMHGLKADCPVPPFGGSEQFNWSPDGMEIAYTLKLANNWAESTDSDVYVIAADGLSPSRCITHGMDGYDNDPVYSSDGRYLAFHSMERPSFEADRNRIMLFDRASGEIRDLTAGLDQTCHGAMWAPDNASLVFASEYRGTNQIFRVWLHDGRVEQVTHGRYNWSHQGFLPDGSGLVLSQQNMLRPAELGVWRFADRQFTLATHINDSIYEGLELPTIQERWVRASDGKLIHNWVIFPPDFDASDTERQWPMLTYCQGGPQGQIGQWFSYRWNFHLMASQGYVVLAVNRRGLPGFGRRWNDQISGDWGGQAMQDILAATDEMIAQPYVDAKRVAAIGASFGGYTVYWLMGNSQDRFACMISHCGVFNLESMYGSTEELFFVNWDLGGPYWKSDSIAAKYFQFSPHRFVGNWKTPLLVVHGEKDFRVPVTQGMEAFTAAQVQGVPSRFLYYPQEGHWVLSPQNGVLWHRVFFDWLGTHCHK